MLLVNENYVALYKDSDCTQLIMIESNTLNVKYSFKMTKNYNSQLFYSDNLQLIIQTIDKSFTNLIKFGEILWKMILCF